VDTDTSILVLGETGTARSGRPRPALQQRAPGRAVHSRALRGDPSELLESELFGHEKGSFTGAFARRIGMFERPGGRDLFLDEIGEMPLGTQSKLLRASRSARSGAWADRKR